RSSGPRTSCASCSLEGPPATLAAKRGLMDRKTTIVIAGVAAGIVAAGAIAWAVKSFSGASPTEQTMASRRAQPLVGQVLADNPEIEAKVRAAVEEDV